MSTELGADPFKPGENYYDDLDANIHILYDDSQVLPEPALAVPQLLHPGEVAGLAAVESVLGPMITELGNRPDTDYSGDPRWQQVVDLVKAAHAKMTESPEVD